MTDTNALATRGAQALLQRPDYIKSLEGDNRGSENITKDDVRLPALRLAQSGSPERKRDHERYVKGLEDGFFFNSQTQEIYGEGPLEVIIVQMLGHRHVEFRPMNEGGGVIDFNVADNDPRTEFTNAVVDGVKKRVKPVATKFYDYLAVVVLPDGRKEFMQFSLKSTQLKHAIQLNSTLAKLNLPSFTVKFSVTARPERGQQYSWHGWCFTPVGWNEPAVIAECEKLYESMKDKKVVLDTEEPTEAKGDTDIPF